MTTRISPFCGHRYRGDEDLVFADPDSGEVLVHASIGNRFKKALRAAGVREIHFNDLRHTFGTRMAAAGVPMRTPQAWMGHRDFRTTLITDQAAAASREPSIKGRGARRG